MLCVYTGRHLKLLLPKLLPGGENLRNRTGRDKTSCVTTIIVGFVHFLRRVIISGVVVFIIITSSTNTLHEIRVK